jgi:hypothetical protein
MIKMIEKYDHIAELFENQFQIEQKRREYFFKRELSKINKELATAKRKPVPEIKTATIQDTATPEQQFYTRFTTFRIKLALKYTPAIHAALKAQIHQYFQEHGQISKDQMTHVLRELYQNAARRYGWIIYRDLRKEKGFAQDGILAKLIRQINKYFDQHILRMVTDITETTRRWVQKETVEGLSRGESYETIARRLVSDEFNIMRARRIARTESVRATNQSGIEGARASGLKMNKHWISARDLRVRHEPKDMADHVLANGMMVGLDDFFPVPSQDGNDLMQAPGDPNAPAYQTVNCRCCCGFVALRDSNGRLIRNA